jgi:hypothetical protein
VIFVLYLLNLLGLLSGGGTIRIGQLRSPIIPV